MDWDSTENTTATPSINFGPPEIDPSEVELHRQIGEGSFGVVYAGRCRQKDVAVKILSLDFDDKTLQAFRHEVEVMSKIFHPNVNLFMGACTKPGRLMIVTELMRADVDSLLLDQQPNLSLLARLKLARDSALGVCWLHASNPQIIHRDLKPSNLLVDENFNCKICDFGLSQLNAHGKKLIDGQDGAKGTPLWMAPEVMMNEPFNEKADVYSFGLILWFLLMKEEPFTEFQELEPFTKAICIDKMRPPIPDTCNPNLKTLIENCWHPNPNMRPTFKEIIPRIEDIMVDLAVEDMLGRDFWKTYFIKKDVVPWSDFIDAFCRHFSLLPDELQNHRVTYLLTKHPEALEATTLPLDLKCLRSILADEGKVRSLSESQDESVVSIEKFGSILQWFGPLTVRPFPPDGLNILERVRALLSENWFHGDISTIESEDRLRNKPDGTFLVRFSTSSPGCYTISKVSGGTGIKHRKILRVPGGSFEINGRHYRNVKELVRTESTVLGLQYACSGSRFTSLFYDRENLQGGGYVG